MSDEKDLGKELLKQNGIEPGSLAEGQRKEVRRMIERDKKRVTRMKWATVGVGLLLVVLCFIVNAVIQRVTGSHAMIISPVFVLVVLFWVLVVSGVVRYFRSRAVTQREIQLSLTDIAEQLKQLTKDQQTKAED